jgi:arsenate reductase
MTLQIYGIPNCETCKKALKWLDINVVDFEFINLKEKAPSRKEIAQWVAILGSKALRNTSGKSYRELGEEKQEWTEEQWIDAFAKDAMLIKRPLFLDDEEAIHVGFRQPQDLREKLRM